jgi:hypothetical protein
MPVRIVDILMYDRSDKKCTVQKVETTRGINRADLPGQKRQKIEWSGIRTHARRLPDLTP